MRPVVADQHALGSRFNSKLADELRSAGLSLYTDKRREWSFEIEGVPEALCDLFSKRSKQINKELEKVGRSDFEAKRQASLRTRKAKSHYGVFSREALLERWRTEALDHGFDLKALQELGTTKVQSQEKKTFEKAKNLLRETIRTEAIRQVESRGKVYRGQLANETFVKRPQHREITTEVVEREIERELSSSFVKVKDGGRVPRYVTAEIAQQLAVAPDDGREVQTDPDLTVDAAAAALELSKPASVSALFCNHLSKAPILAVSLQAWEEKDYRVIGLSPRDDSISWLKYELGIKDKKFSRRRTLRGVALDGLARIAGDRKAIARLFKQMPPPRRPTPIERGLRSLFSSKEKTTGPTVVLVDRAQDLNSRQLAELTSVTADPNVKLVLVAENKKVADIAPARVLTGKKATEELRSRERISQGMPPHVEQEMTRQQGRGL